jgi:phage-related baseplate assembly protein
MYTPPSKDIKYLGRDFDSIKQGLVDFVKTYYPNTYNDFNEASPGMMFLELVAYVGDTLNYYVDSQLKESLLLQATEKKNVLAIAAAMGYKPKISVPSNVTLDVYQLMPVTGSGINAQPDTRYTLRINPGMRVQSTVNVSSPTIAQTVPVDFYVQDIVDFAIDTVGDPVEYSIYTLDANGNPEYYLAKKQVNAVSAAPVTTTIEVGAPTKFFKFKIPFDTTPPDFIGIDNIIDSDGNTWYEVPYLAQDTIFEQITNTAFNDPDAAVYSDEIPYLLKLKKVPRRFVTRILDDGIEIQFGAGISTSEDEELLPTPDNIGVNLPTGKIDMDASIDPNTPGVTKAYGIAPSNTTLTVTYLKGGGVNSNVASNVITTITGVDTSIVNFPTNTTTLNTTILNSLAVNNPQAASGGRAEETLDEVRQNALKQLSSQNRAVTREDYIIRALAMPPQFGSVTKVFITPDEQNNLLTGDSGDMVANPLAMNMYILGYNEDKQITTVNRAVKENLKSYISHYRMLTDSINIRDAYVVNIQVNFDIIPLRDRNANEVLLTCINAMKDYFNIDKWQISQPIMLSDIYNMLLAQPGVQTVTKVDISNLNDSSLGYSNIFYGVQQATRNGIIYPSLDPMIFEVKFPDNDIKGRIATY